MSIIYVQPVFGPDKTRLKQNLASIESFGVLKNSDPYKDVDVIFGGWCADDEYWKEIKECVKTHVGSGIPIKKFDKNYGKATIVNSLYKEKGDKQYDFILSADSDILFDPSQTNFFLRAMESARISEIVKQKPFGMISFNQRGQNCHLPSYVYQNRHPYKGSFGQEEIVWPHGRGGIAGGCIFTSTRCWEEIGGYRVMGVYAGDDAYYLVDCMNRNYSIQMFESCHVIHPADHDSEYAMWKRKVCQRDSSGTIKTNISDKIKEAEDFWVMKRNEKFTNE